MTVELADYWARLTGTVHPDDARVFEEHPDHGFNLDYPPPAFVGDVVNAPVIILENNGGYDASRTPAEFDAPGAADEYRAALARPRPLDRTRPGVSAYYLNSNYAAWLQSGEAAVVNGVAYRSVDGKQKHVVRLAGLLPSALFHQAWLRRILLPLVRDGSRFVIVKRWKLWNGAPEDLRDEAGVIFSTSPVSPHLSAPEREAVMRFLGR